MPAGTKAHWIWDHDSAADPLTTPNTDLYLRKAFTGGGKATLAITADNAHTAWLDGAQVSIGTDWTKPITLTLDLGAGGTHVLAVKVTNQGGPGGLLVDLQAAAPPPPLRWTPKMRQLAKVESCP